MGRVYSTSRMNSLFTFAFMFFFAIVSGQMDEAPTYSCPEVDVDFNGCDVNSVHEQTDWHACGEICELTPECRYWTLGAYNMCLLKSCDSGKREIEGAISGVRGCK